MSELVEGCDPNSAALFQRLWLESDNHEFDATVREKSRVDAPRDDIRNDQRQRGGARPTGGDPFPSAEVIDEGRRQFEELFELIALLRGEEGLQAQSLKRQLRDDLFPDLDRKANGFAQSVERFWTGASEDQSCRGVISGEARTMLDRIFNHANDPNARLLREHPWVLRGGGDMNGRFGGDMNGRFGGGPHAATPTPAVAQPCSPGSHTFTRRQCLVCLDCGCCTGWGRVPCFRICDFMLSSDSQTLVPYVG
jgi:hypothetical protein